MKLTLISMFVFMTTTAFAIVPFEEWKSSSHPAIMDPSFVHGFYQLPLEAKVKDDGKFWSGDYWPFNKGSINRRWNTDHKFGFRLSSPTKAQAAQMSLEELAALAPTEKYDLFIGRYDFPLRNEVAVLGNPGAADWEGICHGWAPAAMNHKEPTPKVVVNPDGIKIPFGSADIKGLLSYYYAFGFNVDNTHQMGSRCFGRRSFWNFKKECKEDLNAGAFHIVLGNKIGLQGVGFLADVDRYKEVWNHPISGYKSEILRDNISKMRGSAPGTVKNVHVKTHMYYIDETENTWETLLTTPLQIVKSKEIEYFLDLDGSGRILGGKWKGNTRPDFLWLKAKPQAFEGTLSRLGELLND